MFKWPAPGYQFTTKTCVFHAAGRFSRWNNEVFTLAGLKMLRSTVSIKDVKVLRKDYSVVYSMNRLHESLGFSSSYLLFKVYSILLNTFNRLTFSF